MKMNVKALLFVFCTTLFASARVQAAIEGCYEFERPNHTTPAKLEIKKIFSHPNLGSLLEGILTVDGQTFSLGNGTLKRENDSEWCGFDFDDAAWVPGQLYWEVDFGAKGLGVEECNLGNFAFDALPAAYIELDQLRAETPDWARGIQSYKLDLTQIAQVPCTSVNEF